MAIGISKDDGWFVGEDQLLEWDVTDKAGNPQDITGWSIQFKMSATNTGASLLTLTGFQIGTYRCRITVSAASTLGLPGGTYFYELARTDVGFKQVIDDDVAVLQARIA